MPDRKILQEKGFEIFEETFYHRRFRDIEMILTEEDGVPVLFVPCATPQIDEEAVIHRFLAEQFANEEHFRAEYHDRHISVKCPGEEVCSLGESLDTVLPLAERVITEFDMLPVCMKCGRVMPVELRSLEGSPCTVCGVCVGELSLDEKKAKLLEEQRKRYENEYTVANIQKRPVKASIKAGVIAGAMTSVVGFVYMMIGCLFLGMLSQIIFWALGGLAGFITIRNLNKISHISVFLRFVIGNISALVTLFILSGISFLFLNAVEYQGQFLTVFATNLPIFYLGSPVAYMAIMGLGFFFVSEFVFGYIFPGKGR